MTIVTLSPAERIRALGSRVTPARVAVMCLLDSAERAMSHHDIEQALHGNGFDRVTLYRVLDWMVECGIAHRMTDAQRVFRFSRAAASAPAHDHHAHFRCEDCGKVFCLEQVPVTRPVLPKGFSSSAVELCITGHCERCGDAQVDAAS